MGQIEALKQAASQRFGVPVDQILHTSSLTSLNVNAPFMRALETLVERTQQGQQYVPRHPYSIWGAQGGLGVGVAQSCDLGLVRLCVLVNLFARSQLRRAEVPERKFISS